LIDGVLAFPVPVTAILYSSSSVVHAASVVFSEAELDIDPDTIVTGNEPSDPVGVTAM
jgi:hypothetical protein